MRAPQTRTALPRHDGVGVRLVRTHAAQPKPKGEIVLSSPFRSIQETVQNQLPGADTLAQSLKHFVISLMHETDRSVHKPWLATVLHDPAVVGLFAGVGGFRLASRGHQAHLGTEITPWSGAISGSRAPRNNTLQKITPSWGLKLRKNRWCLRQKVSDSSTTISVKCPHQKSPIRLLVGGFPCRTTPWRRRQRTPLALKEERRTVVGNPSFVEREETLLRHARKC